MCIRDSPLTLHDFLTWGIARFPADRYLIVLSNHGGSWYNEDSPVPNELWYGDKGMCYDNNYAECLNLYELESVYRDIKTLAGGKLDVIWYQGCLMGAVEVAAVSKDYFDWMVGHETVRYGNENTGKFPNVITFLNGDPTAEDAAGKCVDAPAAPADSYCSSLDLSKYGDLESAITQFVNATVDHADFESFKADLQTILGEVRRVGPPGSAGDLGVFMQNGDIEDFFQRVADAPGENIPAAVKTAATGVVDAVGPMVDTAMGNDAGPEGLHGVAIWLPRTPAEFNAHAATYSGFDFAARTRWPYFLSALYGVAYRIELTWGAEPRDLDSHLYDAQSPAGHVYYGCRECIPGAALDVDDVTSYGPENIRISYLTDGPRDVYEYKVHLYSGAQSSEVSTVKVFRGGQPTPSKTYYRTWNDELRWWHVFNIETDTGNIVDVDSPALGSALAQKLPAK
jgi:hypothetical protein